MTPKDIKLDVRTEPEILDAMIKISKEYPDYYLICFAAMFAPYVWFLKRIGTHTPGDCCYSWYVKNGKKREFTRKQIIREQNACLGRD